MKLFRICSSEEIDALKSGGNLRFTFGGVLYKYINKMSNYCNHYQQYNNMWQEINENINSQEHVKAVLNKYLGQIPNGIPLFSDSSKRRKSIMKKFLKENDRRYHFPTDIKNFENGLGPDLTYLCSIKVGAFFENPEYHRQLFEFRGIDEKRAIAIEMPDEKLKLYRGEGKYQNMETGREWHEEYAVPMFAIKPHNVITDYKVGDATYNKFVKEYNEKNKDL